MPRVRKVESGEEVSPGLDFEIVKRELLPALLMLLALTFQDERRCRVQGIQMISHISVVVKVSLVLFGVLK